MEGFWGIIRSEMYYLTKFYNYDELLPSIDKYVDSIIQEGYRKN